MKKIKVFYLVTAILVLSLAVWSCGKDQFGGTTTPKLSPEDYRVSIKYDAEVTIMQKTANASDADKLSDYDKITALPVKKRVGIQMGIRADGTSDWIIEKKDPSNPIEPIYKAPMDPTPRAKTFKIQNNTLTTYDDKGKVIRTRELNLNDLTKNVLDIVKHDPLQVSLRGARDIASIIREARDGGATVMANVDSSIYVIKKSIQGTDQYSLTYLDAKIGKVKGTAIFTNSGAKVYSSDIVYSLANQSNNEYTITDMVEYRYGQSPHTNLPVVTEKLTHFLSFEQRGF